MPQPANSIMQQASITTFAVENDVSGRIDDGHGTGREPTAPKSSARISEISGAEGRSGRFLFRNFVECDDLRAVLVFFFGVVAERRKLEVFATFRCSSIS